jgi:L-seryl-tRNA(Ser) seleniumtransferase
LREAVAPRVRAEVVEGESEVGGGSFPGARLKTWLVRLTADGLTADGLMARLRAGDPPVIARIEDDGVVLDARTIDTGDVPAVTRALGG